MKKVDCTTFHVGHGAMNLIQLVDDQWKKCNILIDAGSTQEDVSDKIREGLDWVKDKIKASKAGEWILCLTHIHSDHYNYISYILNGSYSKVSKFYVGSTTKAEFDTLVKNNSGKQALCSLRDTIYDLGEKVVFLSHKDKPIAPLWDNGEVYLYALFNHVTSKNSANRSNLNCNCANFLVKNEKKNKMLWVTGDATGCTFSYFLNNRECTESIKKLINKGRVYFTVPHHGSVDTLISDGFATETKDKWIKLCERFGIRQYYLILNCCIWDKYDHPSGEAMDIYLKNCNPEYLRYEWEVWRNGDWSKQTGNYSLYPTVKYQRPGTSWFGPPKKGPIIEKIITDLNL